MFTQMLYTTNTCTQSCYRDIKYAGWECHILSNMALSIKHNYILASQNHKASLFNFLLCIKSKINDSLTNLLSHILEGILKFLYWL